MSIVKFILDRNVRDKKLIAFLHENGFYYTLAEDHSSDVEIVRTSALQKQIIITRDGDFITRAYEREKSYGIVYISQKCRDVVKAFQNALNCIQAKRKMVIVDERCNAKCIER